MPRGRVPTGGKAPFCADCGSTDCHVVSVKETRMLIHRGEERRSQELTFHVWLCGSCEMLRQNPEAAKRDHPQGLPVNWPRGRGKPQKETLF